MKTWLFIDGYNTGYGTTSGEDGGCSTGDDLLLLCAGGLDEPG